jgi:hypothetical protein
MSSPAGFPCLVITTSSSSARWRYFDRSSFIFARATLFIGYTFLPQPFLRLILRDDGQDLDDSFADVVEHADVIDPQAVLGLTKPPEPLDPTPADACRFIAEMLLDRVANAGTDMCPKPA